MSDSDSSSTITAIVPARNEDTTIGRCVASLAAQFEIQQVIIINDHSTDRTADVLEELAAREPKVCVMDAAPLPEGWVGKNHAAWLGSQEAAGRWLLFTDADVLHLPGSAARALADAESSGAQLVSYSPAQEMRRWWERALIPFVFCRLSHLYPYAAVNSPDSPVAAANGQFLMIRRDAYGLIGGHAAVRGEVVEDVALARLAKAAGVSVRFEPGEGIARVRMYETFGAMWEGWTKNLAALLAGAKQKVTRELVTVIPWIPLTCLALAPRHLIFGALGLLLLAGRFASYAAQLRRNRFPTWIVIYYLGGVALYVAALMASDINYARGKVSWRGRDYSPHGPGA